MHSAARRDRLAEHGTRRRPWTGPGTQPQPGTRPRQLAATGTRRRATARRAATIWWLRFARVIGRLALAHGAKPAPWVPCCPAPLQVTPQRPARKVGLTPVLDAGCFPVPPNRAGAQAGKPEAPLRAASPAPLTLRDRIRPPMQGPAATPCPAGSLALLPCAGGACPGAPGCHARGTAWRDRKNPPSKGAE